MEAVPIESARPSINEMLMGFVDSQRTELSSLRNKIPNYHDPKVLFNWYRESDIFRKLKGEVTRADSFFDPERVNKEEVKGRVPGRIFQDLSFVHFALTQPESQVLLSPQRTLEFFKAIFPKVKVVNHPLEQDSLRTFVPDGMIVETREGTIRPVIRQVLEYGARRNGRKRIFEKKLSSFDQQKKDPNASEFLADANLKFIVPRVDGEIHLAGISMLNVGQSPFSRAEIRRFMQNNLPEAMESPIINNSAVGTAA